MLEELPASLTTLWVEACSSSSAFVGTFKRLPPSLTSLHLRSCHSLVAPRFANLPLTLQVLGTSTLASDFLFLLLFLLLFLQITPSVHTDLSGSRGISGHMLERLPRGLRALNLRDCRGLMLAELVPALCRLHGTGSILSLFLSFSLPPPSPVEADDHRPRGQLCASSI
jgi:hypothetical protein